MHKDALFLIKYNKNCWHRRPAWALEPESGSFIWRSLSTRAVFIVLGVLFLLLFIFMFMPSGETPLAEADSHQYTAGIYTASMTLEGNPVEIGRHSRRRLHLLYPFPPAGRSRFCHVSSWWSCTGISFCTDLEKQSLDQLSYSEDSQYTFSSCYEVPSGTALQRQRTQALCLWSSSYSFFPSTINTDPIKIKKSAKLNTRWFSHFQGLWNRI